MDAQGLQKLFLSALEKGGLLRGTTIGLGFRDLGLRGI